MNNEKREFVDHQNRYNKIKKVLEEEGPCFIKKIASKVGLSYEVTYQELERLVDDKQLETWKEGNRNIYALPGTHPNEEVEGSQSISTVTHASYDLKECGKCNETKPRTEFSPGATYCHDCERERAKEIREKQSTPGIQVLSQILPGLFQAKEFNVEPAKNVLYAFFEEQKPLLDLYESLPINLKEITKLTIDPAKNILKISIPLGA